MGQAAVRLLLDEIAEKDTHHNRSIVFPPTLVIRQSA
jgi:DNA-binding LacI/PurR family transcriptional regulator